MSQAVISSSVVSEPNIVASLIELKGHWLSELRRREPGVGRHTKTRHDENRLRCSPVNWVVTDRSSKSEQSKNVTIICSSGVRLPIILKLVHCVSKGGVVDVIL